MSEANLKKGPAWVLSTTLDAGRLDVGRMAALAALINNLCHAKTPGALRRVQGPWGRGAPFFIDNDPTDFLGVGGE